MAVVLQALLKDAHLLARQHVGAACGKRSGSGPAQLLRRAACALRSNLRFHEVHAFTCKAFRGLLYFAVTQVPDNPANVRMRFSQRVIVEAFAFFNLR